MRMYAAQKKQLSRRASADENHASSSAHDSGDQFRNFGIWKCMLPIRSEWRKCAVVIEQQRTRRRTAQTIEKCGAHILVYSDTHRNSSSDRYKFKNGQIT